MNVYQVNVQTKPTPRTHKNDFCENTNIKEFTVLNNVHINIWIINVNLQFTALEIWSVPNYVLNTSKI